MATQKLLKKTFIVENSVIKINESIEKEMSKEELVREKFGLINQQQSILRQVEEIKARYAMISETIKELDMMISSFLPDDIDIKIE